MTWLRVDDGALTHPKTMRLRSLGARTGTPDLAESVIGFVVLAASWSGKHNTDCLILESVGPLASPARWLELSDAAIAVGIMSAADHPSGDAAWVVDISDHLFHLLSSAEVEQNRERRNAPRRNAARVAVLLRDGDVCRYCAHTVNPYDSSWGGWGRHFEHPDPTVPDEMVVGCRRCNQAKGDRTPAEAGLELLPPPDVKYWHPKTLEWLRKQGCTEADGLPPVGTPPDGNQPPGPARPDRTQRPDPAPARPGTQPDNAKQPSSKRKRTTGATTTPAPASRAAPDPAPTITIPPPSPGSAEPPSAGTGRDGQGRVGSGRASPTSATRTRRRGRRGRPRGGGPS